MLKECKIHHTSNQTISATALKNLNGQFWYLSEELVTLALFDEGLDAKHKRIAAMNEREGEEKWLKRH